MILLFNEESQLSEIFFTAEQVQVLLTCSLNKKRCGVFRI